MNYYNMDFFYINFIVWCRETNLMGESVSAHVSTNQQAVNVKMKSHKMVALLFGATARWRKISCPFRTASHQSDCMEQ